MAYLKFATLLLLLHLHLHYSSASSPNVRLENGYIVRGTQIRTEEGYSVDRFLGIPYAKPPVGPLRFKPPQAYEWTDNIDASNVSSPCVQLDALENKGPIGDEDCLYLNIFTPANQIFKNLPVLVWIHGGGFNWGSSQLNAYTPYYFIEEDVIVVTFNYRLGPLGFLNIQDDCSISGNMGLKDQTMALKWVKQYIAAFGGDPNLVTIFGESAGGASVHFHLLSTYSKGLFSRAIAESGSALNSFAWDYHPKWNALKLAKALNYSEEIHGSLTEFLLTIDPIALTTMSFYILPPKDQALVPYVFFPSAENDKCNEVFITKHPIELMNTCSPDNLIPLLTGINKDEGMFSIASLILFGAIYNISFYENIESNFIKIIPSRLLESDYNKEETPDKIWDKMREFYLGNKNHFTSDDEKQLIQMNGDAWFSYDVWTSAIKESKRRNVFFYYYTYEGPPGIFTKAMNLHLKGTSHGDELSYLFSGSLHDECYSRREKPALECKTLATRLSKEFVHAWSDFARTGVPREDWSTLRGCDSWPCYMHINKYWNMESGEPLKNRTCFWDKLYGDNKDRTPSSIYKFKVEFEHE